MRPTTWPVPALAACLLALAACGGSKSATAGGAPPGEPTPPAGGRVAALPCTTETAQGDWQTEAGADFQSISLNADGSFGSFLHDRPFTSGTWRVDGEAVVLEAQDGTTTRIEGARCAPLALFGQAGGAELRLARLPQAGALCQQACANVQACEPEADIEACMEGCDDRDPITRCLAERPDCASRQGCYGL
jgi:hypothetical protein